MYGAESTSDRSVDRVCRRSRWSSPAAPENRGPSRDRPPSSVSERHPSFGMETGLPGSRRSARSHVAIELGIAGAVNGAHPPSPSMPVTRKRETRRPITVRSFYTGRAVPEFSSRYSKKLLPAPTAVATPIATVARPIAPCRRPWSRVSPVAEYRSGTAMATERRAIPAIEPTPNNNI